MTSTTAVVVDDAPVVREGLPTLMPRIAFVGSYPTVEAMLADAPETDLVVLDLHLANPAQPVVRQGLAAVRSAATSGYRICVYTQEERRFVLAACFVAGASGLVSKSASLADAERDFREVAAGAQVLPPQVIGLIDVLVRRNRVTILSERQRQVLTGRARGFTYAELSHQLFLSESTLRGYWRDVIDQVGAYLRRTTPAEIEHALGLAPGDLLDFWPDPPHPEQVADPPPQWWHLDPRAT
ncbi:MAG: LuxR C-terminal-related transcriptional regulator [Nocardioides sp.]